MNGSGARTWRTTGGFSSYTQRTSEMWGLLCGTATKPGIVHTLDRTVAGLEKLERVVGDFVTTTAAALSNHSAKLDKIGDIVTRHESQLANDTRQKLGFVSSLVKIAIEGAVRGSVQLIVLLIGIAAYLARTHLPLPILHN